VQLCPHRPPCPGCPRFGERGLASEAGRALARLVTEARLPAPVVVEGPAFGWRHRARLAVRGRSASPKVGIFQEGTHRIVDIPQCLVHHPLVNRVAAAVKDAVRATGTMPYADRPHAGVLRYVQVVVERPSERAQVVLVANGEEPAACEALAEAVTDRLGESLHSLWWNGNPERTNVILGPHWHRWRGPEAVREEIGGAEVFFPPGAFGQANLDLADRMVAQVAEWVPDGARLVEYYAGCGAIGLGLLARAERVAFNEAVPDALAGLVLGIAARPWEERGRAEVLAGPADEHVARIDDADVVIVDPPRKGLDAALLARLVESPPARLIAVSCNLDAFLGEARTLRAAGKLRLAAVVPFALFPHTAHVETVALFRRDGSA
jgi:tRNA/tmRNA/rRNA uracil-C5-methylase (TrmA/RlmC/RlmD family)